MHGLSKCNTFMRMLRPHAHCPACNPLAGHRIGVVPDQLSCNSAEANPALASPRPRNPPPSPHTHAWHHPNTHPSQQVLLVADEPGLGRAATHVALCQVGQDATQLLHIIAGQLLFNGRQEPGAQTQQATRVSLWLGRGVEVCPMLCMWLGAGFGSGLRCRVRDVTKDPAGTGEWLKPCSIHTSPPEQTKHGLSCREPATQQQAALASPRYHL
jgi:hypothetical protein